MKRHPYDRRKYGSPREGTQRLTSVRMHIRDGEWELTREYTLDDYAPNDSAVTRRRTLRRITECGAISAIGSDNHQL